MSFNLDLIDKLTESSAAILYLIDKESSKDFFAEINYLSNNLLSKTPQKKKAPQIVFTKMFKKPFFFYIQEKDLFNKENFFETLKTFVKSNNRSESEVLCLGPINSEKLKSEIKLENVFFRKV